MIAVPAAFGFAMGWLREPKEHILPLVLAGMALFFVLFVFVIALIILQVISKDFLVPQIALDDISAFEAWRRLWAMMKQELVGYASYLGMKVVLAVAAGIAWWECDFYFWSLHSDSGGRIGSEFSPCWRAKWATWNAYTITVVVVAAASCWQEFSISCR